MVARVEKLSVGAEVIVLEGVEVSVGLRFG